MKNDRAIKLVATGFVLSQVPPQWWPLVSESLYHVADFCDSANKTNLDPLPKICYAVQSLSYFNFVMKLADANLPVTAVLVNKWHLSCYHTPPNSCRV
jgi:hypothetical protein